MKLPRIDIRWLYVMYTFSHLFRFKVGIAKDVEQRRASVEASMSSALNRRVKIRVALYVPSLFSEAQEAKIHRWLNPIRDKGMVHHSGYSEWFYFLNIGSAFGIYLISKHYGLNVTPCHIALYAIIPLFPLDAALLVFAVFMAEIIIFLGSVVLAGFILYHAFQFL